jgi:DNA-directed RNA polymerase subunit alpha
VLHYQIDRIEHQVAEDRSQIGTFLIGPLDRGQATTLGNALRRVLIGSLEGSAITAVRISGVNHEYATVPGVREDVLDILLNCKQISVSSRNRELEIGRLVVNGPATVTAADLQFSSQVQVIDSDRLIATVAEGHSLEMEVHVERGVGYRPVNRHSEDTNAIDLLQIDAVFKPVRRVNYTVDETAVGEGPFQEALPREPSGRNCPFGEPHLQHHCFQLLFSGVLVQKGLDALNLIRLHHPTDDNGKC